MNSTLSPPSPPHIITLMAALILLSLGSTACLSTPSIDDPLAPRSEARTSSTGYPIEIDLRSSRGDRANHRLVDGSAGNRLNLKPPHDPWLTQGLEKTFAQAGFQVVENTQGQAPLLFVQVSELRGEQRAGFPLPLFGFVASFDVTLQIPTAQGPLNYERNFISTARERSPGGTSPGNKERMIRNALDEVFTEIVEETSHLLANHH